MSDELLTLADAADVLRCSERSLRRRIDANELPVFRDRRIVRIRRSDLDAYIAQRTRVPQQAGPRKQLPRLRALHQPLRSLFDLPDPLVDRSRELDLSSDLTRKRPGGAGTPRGRHQGGTP